MNDNDIDDRKAVIVIAAGLMISALLLLFLTRVLKFQFVIGA